MGRWHYHEMQWLCVGERGLIHVGLILMLSAVNCTVVIGTCSLFVLAWLLIG